MQNSKHIAYTLGEPAGIGADIILQLARRTKIGNLTIIGDANALTERANKLGLSACMNELTVQHVAVQEPTVCGTLSSKNAEGVINMLNAAIDGCVSGEFSAMVTGPLHKGILIDGGFQFSGHTEYLAHRTRAKRSVMLLSCEAFKVALQTTHLPLSNVSQALSTESIIETCEIIHHDFQRRFGLGKPRIAVCGVNPHAGEGGHLGREEIEVISPAIKALNDRGIHAYGPVSADTAFTPHALRHCDVVLTMFHDQGLPVLKAMSFGAAANITLGLPIIRTSVDHGTALDLAGSGKADTGGLEHALAVAQQMVARSQSK